jgi:hypothetical protein
VKLVEGIAAQHDRLGAQRRAELGDRTARLCLGHAVHAPHGSCCRRIDGERRVAEDPQPIRADC